MALPMPVQMAPTREMTQGRRAKINVRGRGSPTAPQGLIVETMYANPSVFTFRSRRENPYYPVGQKSDHSLLQGELAFTVASEDYRMKGALPNSSQRVAFTAMNGLDYLEPVQFVGVVKKGFDMDRATSDNAVTISTAGMETINNTGDEHIPGGCVVIWDYPLAERGRSGVLHSRLDIWGVSKTKFTAAVRPLRMQSVFGMFRELMIEIRQIVKRITTVDAYDMPTLPQRLQAGEPDRLKTAFEGLWKKYSFFKTEGPSETMNYLSEAEAKRIHQSEANQDPVSNPVCVSICNDC